MIPLQSILDAKENLLKIINKTPLQFSQTFSEMTGNRIYLKPECLQKNGSFKIRGAYTMLSRMSDEEKKRGVITFSAGNWAQGVAYGASMLNIKAVVILPEWANRIKVEATKGYGAEVIIHGKDSQELLEKAYEMHKKEGYVYINPFSNINMITGSATIGVEIIEEKPDTEAIVVPIGGGALISGIAIGTKNLKSDVKIYGVQPNGANAVYQSLQKGEIVELEKVETIADGLAVKKANEQALEFIKQFVDEIILISDDEIKQAIYLLIERAKLVVEPAGATALAGVLTKKIKDLKDRKIVVVLTGGNIDFSLLKSLL
ncbi:MAG: threonine/serine dehydratase [bacterium]